MAVKREPRLGPSPSSLLILQSPQGECKKMQKKIQIPRKYHQPSISPIIRVYNWLLYQAANCGRKSEGHWQGKASVQGGSGQGLLQLRKNFSFCLPSAEKLQLKKTSAEKTSAEKLETSFSPSLIFIQSKTRAPCGIIPIKEHFPSGNDLILFNFFSQTQTQVGNWFNRTRFWSILWMWF